MVTHESGGHHHPPTGFIRKYIFSLDHKVIGIQYYFLALFSVFVGMALSLLMRIHLVWPNLKLPFTPGGHDDAGAVSGAGDHARLDHGVHGADHRAAVGLRKLLLADSDRRRGHGVSGPQHAFVLDHVRFAVRAGLGVLRYRRRAHLRLDRLSAAERAWADHRARARRGPNAVGHRPGDLLPGVAVGRAEFHRHHGGPARQGHDLWAACR